VPKRSNFLRIFGTLLAFALLIYLLSQQGWDEIWLAVQKIHLWRLVLALGLMLVSRLAVSGRWYVLLRSANTRISSRQSLRVTFAGLFASNFLPTTIGGDIIRLAGAIQLQCNPATCAASLIVDRIIGMIGMIMALPLGILSILPMRPQSEQPFSPIALISALGLGNWWKKAWQKIQEITQQVFKAISLWIGKPYVLLQALILSWVHMLCLFGTIQLILSGLGEHLSFWSIAGLYSLVYFITLLPVSINGYGLQEISITFAFSHFAGASMNSSLITALLFRTLMMLASLPGALFIPDILAARELSEEHSAHLKDHGAI
jgi:uncharacterized membrane protein YbhN (UPF0104 family)